MALVNGFCPNCKRSIVVESKLRAAICQYCNQAYVVSDACDIMLQSDVNSYYFDKAKKYFKIGEDKKAKDFLVEAFSENPENNEIAFFYKMTCSHFSKSEAIKYIQEHPIIEEYEYTYLSVVKGPSAYFRTFFPWYGGDVFDQQRCELYCRMVGSCPIDREETFVYVVEGRYYWRPLWQIEYLFKHDTKKILQPYKKFKLVPYGDGSDRVMSLYDIFIGKGDAHGCIGAPHLSKNTDIARLIEKYYI